MGDARGGGNETRRANQLPAPRVSIIFPKLHASARIALRWLSGSGLRSCPQGQLASK